MTSLKESFGSWFQRQNLDLKDPKLTALAREEIDQLLKKPGHVEPVRNFLDEPGTDWRQGQPNYSIANLAFLKGKSMNHDQGSLEMIVENAVKSWEMEASNKMNASQWKSVVHDEYKVSTNGGRQYLLDEASQRGNYNVLMDHVDKKLYDAAAQDFDSSHKLFKSSFQGAFPWEVLKVFAGPPNIVFSWRHWGDFIGEYQGNKGDGQTVEMTGYGVVKVTDDLKIANIQIYYHPENFLRELQGQEAIREDPTPQDYEALLSIFIDKFDAGSSKTASTLKCKMELNGRAVAVQPVKPVDNISNEKLFSWEIVEIFSKAPVCSFSWRHWMESSDVSDPPVELTGFAVVKMKNEEIESFQIFYKLDEAKGPTAAVADLQRCPFSNLM